MALYSTKTGRQGQSADVRNRDIPSEYSRSHLSYEIHPKLPMEATTQLSKQAEFTVFMLKSTDRYVLLRNERGDFFVLSKNTIRCTDILIRVEHRDSFCFSMLNLDNGIVLKRNHPRVEESEFPKFFYF